uniref:HAD family phosphatase n=1 Tax=Desulfobacca acetoxidans TaxID=60893 RepID=A0A7C3SJ98_9BACT
MSEPDESGNLWNDRKPQALHITAIIFDLGNVLIKVDHGRFCRRIGELAGISPQEVYAAVFASGLEPAYDTGRLSSEAFYREVSRLLHIDLPFPRFCKWWQDVFDPMEGMDQIVAALADRYPLYLASNTNVLHFSYVYPRFPLVRRLTRFILSYRVGSRKPETAFYEALIREVQRPPQQCLFLDDKAPFVEAARTHGLVAWQFSTPEDFISRLRRHGLYGSNPEPRLP